MAASKSFSLRLDSSILERLTARARERGESRSSLMQRLAEEGLRMEEHPGIVFRDGPAGRRPGLAAGPDVWEVVKVMHDLGARGEPAIGKTATYLTLDEAQVRAAVRYYAEHRAEIDDWIERTEQAAERARAAWLREQEALG